MERRQVLRGVGATIAGVSVVGSGSASASMARSSSSVVVGVHDDDRTASKEVHYDTGQIPYTHIDGYRRQSLDIVAVTDTRDLDCEHQMTVHVCPEEQNGMRLDGEWGVGMDDGGILQSEESSRLLCLSDVPSAIELTEVGIRVKYGA